MNSYSFDSFREKTKPINPQKLSIFYYNDTHGNSDQIAGIVHSAKQFKADSFNSNSVNFVLSAGDNYSGADVKKNNFIVSLMQNIMGVDLSAVGNHEIDGGVQGLYEVAKNRKTQFIATNVILPENSPIKDIIKKSTIKEQKGVKYGFIGAMPIDFKTCSKEENQKDISVMDFDESIKCLKEALVLSPGNQETMISLGMSYLSQKDIQNGFRYYKFLNKETKDKYKNHWDGKKHPDSTLLVFYYAGYGDHIMFSRYLPFLKDYFKHIKVLLPISVSCLVSKNISGVEFVDSANVEYDYSTSILELPYLLSMDFENIPFSSGYLSADEKKVKEYREKYFLTDKKKIGLFWQGNPKVFANRSIKLEELEPILDMEDIQYYSFVKEDEKNQIDKYPQILNLGQTFKNFEDTAAAMMNLDLFVTIDSSVVHLAGALGVKTCLLLPYSSEWRWFKDEKKTPWYDSVTIYKQKTPYNWQNAVEEIQRFLEK